MKSIDMTAYYERMARKNALPPKLPVVKYTLWSAIGEAPLVDMATGEPVVGSSFRKMIGAMALLFVSNASETCPVSRDTSRKFLAQMSALEVPARVIVVAIDDTLTEFNAAIEGFSSGLLIPFGDPRIHILKSFRDDPSVKALPILATFDAPGNRLNPNAFADMAHDLENLREFPWRPSANMSLVRMFRSEFVDPQLTEQPCIMLVRMFNTAKECEQANWLFEKAAKEYREARGELSRLRFFWTRTVEDVPTAREKEKCRNGHKLERRGAFDTTRCNGCDHRGTTLWACPPCGFDLCENCYSGHKELAHPDVLLLSLLSDEFNREMPRGLCVIGWSYHTGVFAGTGLRDGIELLAFFLRVDQDAVVR